MATRQSQLKQQMEMLQEENRRLEELIRQLGAVTSPGRAKRIADRPRNGPRRVEEAARAGRGGDIPTESGDPQVAGGTSEGSGTIGRCQLGESSRASRSGATIGEQSSHSEEPRGNRSKAELTETVRACEEKAQVAEELERQLANQQQKAELQQFRALAAQQNKWEAREERLESRLTEVELEHRWQEARMRLDEESGLEVERRWREARAGIDESAIRVRRLQEEEKLRYKEELDLLQERRRSTETARLQAELTESKQKEASGMPSLETYGSHWTATDGNQGSLPRANVWREPPPLIRCDERPPVSAQEIVGVPPLARGVQEPAVMLQSDGIGRTDPSLQFSHTLSSLSQLQLPPLPAFSGDDRTLENSSFKNRHKTCNAYSKRPTLMPYKEHPMHRRWAKLC